MERRGGAVGTSEGGVRSWCGRDDGCHSPGGGFFVALILPDFVALLDQGLRLLELLRVDQISDVICGGKGLSGFLSLWLAAGR